MLKFSRKYPPFSLCASLLFLVCTLLVSGCNPTPQVQHEEILRPVRTFVVGSETELQRRSFPGVVDANQKATLSFRIAGNLKSLSIKEGDQVELGQVLATIDDKDFRIQLAEGKASYKRALADLTRAKKLVGKGHVSKADFDKISASEASARAHLDGIQQKIKYSTLTAPFAGQIAKRYVENYQEIGASQPVYLLQDLSLLEVAVDIPSSVMVNAERDRGKLDIFANFEAIPGKSFPLVVKEISTVADDVTQTYAVKLSMPNVSGYTILPGMTATVVASDDGTSTEPTGGFVVPSHSVVGAGTQAFVWVVSATEEERGSVTKKAVEVGETRPNGLEITSGLSIGQLVVTAGMSKLTEGQSVRLKKDR